MAWYPGAIRKEITASKGRDRLTIWNRVNLHIAVSEGDSLFPYFNKSGIPDSHFYVRRDGTVEQYVDTAYNAFADLEGNDATISIETQGMGTGEWTAAQRETLARIYAWAVKTHGIALKMATSSKPGAESKGLSWHRLGVDGNFPALPSILAGRLQRGASGVIDRDYMHYSNSFGKGCPTDDRINQIPGIFKRAQDILGGTPTAQPTTTQERDMLADERAWLDELRTKLLRKFSDGNDVIDIVAGVNRDLIVTRRVDENVKALLATTTAQAAAIQTLSKSVGLDPKTVEASIDTAVKASLANLEITLTTEA
jgi:hypothetical protein